MRRYLTKIATERFGTVSVGELGERVFAHWFSVNHEGDTLHSQSLDRDYQGIDFADNKGYTYQVKATSYKSFTFNSKLDNLTDHLRADFYVFVQNKGDYAYIEGIYNRDYVKTNAKASYSSDTSFVYAKDLQAQKLFGI